MDAKEIRLACLTLAIEANPGHTHADIVAVARGMADFVLATGSGRDERGRFAKQEFEPDHEKVKARQNAMYGHDFQSIDNEAQLRRIFGQDDPKAEAPKVEPVMPKVDNDWIAALRAEEAEMKQERPSLLKRAFGAFGRD